MAKSSKCPEISQKLEELFGLQKQTRDVALKRPKKNQPILRERNL